jgi:predicted DCC family thiol-disulfide oxidoreductase YuxK
MSGSRAIVLYDGQCPLCRKSVAILTPLDWLKRLEFRDARDPANVPAREPPLAPARLLEEMHLITPDGSTVHHGFHVFRWMAWRLPLLWPLAPFLYLPGVPWLGQKVYMWVARNRYQLVPCKDGVCQVPGISPQATEENFDPVILRFPEKDGHSGTKGEVESI